MVTLTRKVEAVIDVENLIISKPKKYLVTIQSSGGILFNRMLAAGVQETEETDQAKISRADKEKLIWRDKLYFDGEDNVFIPGENIHECLKDGSKYWGQKIPGEGNKTYTDIISSAVVVENIDLGMKKDDDRIIPFGKMVNGNPSKGKKSGCKVYKIRPLLMPWGGSFILHSFDARMSISILKTVISYAGTFRGLGDWRPTYGRFELINIKEV